jgi:polyhydroxyalkanoate synthase
MSKVDMDSYVVAGTTDHITPWQGCYETAKLYGERSTFVLSNSGHIQSLINPPGNRKAYFRAAPAHAESADAWLEKSTRAEGSWWPHWLEWIAARSGDKKPAPSALGSADLPVLDQAPGRYVMEK